MTRQRTGTSRPIVVSAVLSLMWVASCATDVCGCSPPDVFVVSVVSGNGQVGAPGEALADSVVVEVTTVVEGAVASGITVIYYPEDGFTSPTQTVTDANGRAAAQWTLGMDTGADTLFVVTAPHAASARFTATVQ